MNSIQKLYKAIARLPLVTLFLLFSGLQSFSIAQTTTFQISGYCFYPPSQAGYYSIPNMNPNSVVINGNYAYVAESSGLVILDISNPINPIEVGNYKTLNCVAVAVSGNYAYVLANNTTSSLLILNIS